MREMNTDIWWCVEDGGMGKKWSGETEKDKGREDDKSVEIDAQLSRKTNTQ